MADELRTRLYEKSSSAERYEKASLSVTRHLFQKLIQYLPPLDASTIIHDNGCGPGIVTDELMHHFAQQRLARPTIHATDASEAMVDAVKEAVRANGWSNVQPAIMDAQKLNLPDHSVDVSISNLVVMVLPNPLQGCLEIYRTLKPGGVAIVTTGRGNGTIKLTRDVQQAIRPDLPLFLDHLKEWFGQEKLIETLQTAGFHPDQIEVREVFNDLDPSQADALAETFAGPFYEMARKGWSEEENARWMPEMRKALDESIERDGKIVMSSWVAIARKE